MESIGVVGSGYVGTVVAACLASLGNRVVAFENHPERLQMLQAGTPYFHEEHLADLLSEGVSSGRLTATDSIDAVSRCDVVFMCVGTPSRPDGYPDMTAMRSAIEAVASHITGSTTLVIKSTVPIGSGDWVRDTVEPILRNRDEGLHVSVVSNPEFLREGLAVEDFFHPARIVVGSSDPDAVEHLLRVYQPIVDQSFEGGRVDEQPHVVRTDNATAEMIKYASNAFLAGKISFANEIARICEHVGSDIVTVSAAVGLDPRIGPQFLAAGVGWGGSCFGKDLEALMATARDHSVDAPMLRAIADINETQRDAVIEKLRDRLVTFQGRRVAVLGLAFKPGTDDTRDSPALAVAQRLVEAGAEVVAYDPMVKFVEEAPDLHIADDPYSAVRDASAVVLMTDWPAFAHIDFTAVAASMSGTLVLDGRNMLDPTAVAEAGLDYMGIGRHAGRTS